MVLHKRLADLFSGNKSVFNRHHHIKQDHIRQDFHFTHCINRLLPIFKSVYV
ncbi:Uncharacterised protein [Vibrio cholerae]|nr:Uncharacterised protein [Vibrio cholerae]